MDWIKPYLKVELLILIFKLTIDLLFMKIFILNQAFFYHRNHLTQIIFIYWVIMLQKLICQYLNMQTKPIYFMKFNIFSMN